VNRVGSRILCGWVKQERAPFLFLFSPPSTSLYPFSFSQTALFFSSLLSPFPYTFPIPCPSLSSRCAARGLAGVLYGRGQNPDRSGVSVIFPTYETSPATDVYIGSFCRPECCESIKSGCLLFRGQERAVAVLDPPANVMSCDSSLPAISSCVCGA